MQARHRNTPLRIVRRTLVASLAAACLCGAQAAEPMGIDIAAQPLAAAIARFAEQSGVKMLYAADLFAGKKAPRVAGRLTPQQALDRLLAGSGLRYQFVAADAAQIEAAPPERVKELAAIEVKDEVVVPYTARRVFAAMKIDAPLMETPISVQTVTREVIEDRHYTRLRDVVENVSGVGIEPSTGEGSRFIVRGFQQDRVFRDGLQANGQNARFPTDFDIATAESIEVVKGPASLAYGRIEPGGLINITTKKPQAEALHSVKLEGGSFAHRRLDADSTGPLDSRGEWLYRLVAAVQDSGTFKDFGQDDRVVFAPSLTWRPSARTDFRVGLEYFRNRSQSEYGTPVVGDRPVRLPVERTFSTDPNDPTQDQRSRTQLNTELNHQLANDWTIRHRFQFGRLQNDEDFINPAPAFGNALRADGRTLDRNIYWQSSDSDNYSTNLDLVGTLKLGATEHNILAGMDYMQGRTYYRTGGSWQAPGDPALAIDIYNPAYGVDPAKFDNVLKVYATHSVFKDRVFGLYLQDRIKLDERWQLLLGGRQDWARTGRGNGADEGAAEAAVPTRKDQAFSPRAALLYKFRPELAGYLSWSKSFGQNNGISATGGTFDPQIGEQYEAGLKSELLGKRLLTNVAVYHLTKANLLTPDLTTADPTDSIAIGEQRSRGVEIDISGSLTDKFNLIASFAYTDAKVTKDNSGNQGHLMPGVARNTASLWGKYDVSATWSVGLGGVYVGDRAGDLANTFTVPAYTRVDAMAAYRFAWGAKRASLQLNIRNLFDRYYFDSATTGLNVASRNGVHVGAPRTLMASLKLDF